jgi:hypothetical protein
MATKIEVSRNRALHQHEASALTIVAVEAARNAREGSKLAATLPLLETTNHRRGIFYTKNAPRDEER